MKIRDRFKKSIYQSSMFAGRKFTSWTLSKFTGKSIIIGEFNSISETRDRSSCSGREKPKFASW